MKIKANQLSLEKPILINITNCGKAPGNVSITRMSYNSHFTENIFDFLPFTKNT